MAISEAALDELETLRGGPLYVGLLNQAALDELLDAGFVETFYEGTAGFFGLAKARLCRPASGE